MLSYPFMGAAAGYGRPFIQPRVHVLCHTALSSRAPLRVSFAPFISTPFMLNLSTLHAWLSRWYTHLISPNVPNPPCRRVTDVLSTVVIAIVPCGVRRSATDTLRGHSNVGVSVICSRARTRATALRIARGRPFPVRCCTPCLHRRLCFSSTPPSARSLNDIMAMFPTVLLRGNFDTGYVVGCFRLTLSSRLLGHPFLSSSCTARRGSTITQHTGSAAPRIRLVIFRRMSSQHGIHVDSEA